VRWTLNSVVVAGSGASMAAATYLALPMLLVSFAFQRYFLRGVTIGALKG
jgi:multiple sugar transport system permease protein